MKPHVLVVEDSPLYQKFLRKVLQEFEYPVTMTQNGRQAWEKLQQRPYPLVITDWVMPEMDGVTLVRRIREAEWPHYIYVIMLTALDEIEQVIEGLDAGADDYLTKPVDPRELAARLRIGERVLELEKRLQRAYEEMRDLAMRDHLTGVYNRRAISDLLTEEISRSLRLHKPLCVVLMDIDHFKQINDCYGHEAGDQALKAFTAGVQTVLRPYDRLGRWGGEEFLLILPETDGAAGAGVAERIRQEIAGMPLPFGEAGLPAQMTVSLGVSCMDGRQPVSLDELVRRADSALYQAKEAGRDCVVQAQFDLKEGR